MHRRPSTPALLAAAALALVPSAARALDADPWDAVLRAHARGGGVDYGALKSDAEAMRRLEAFVAAVADMPASAPLADWLNAYNALVVKAVVDAYPIDSVKDVPGFFDRRRHRVAGASRTLDDVENRVIRPRFRDARVHFALNCAARSCPALRPRAFRAGNVDRALDDLARRAVARPRHVRRADDGGFAVSEIFFWFRRDFVRDAGSVTAWIARHGVDDIGRVDDDDLARIPYDWRLNDR